MENLKFGRFVISLWALALLALVPYSGASARENGGETEVVPPESSAMTVEKLEQIVKRLDKNFEREEGMLSFTFGEQSITIIADPVADRMRVIIPVMKATGLNEEMLYRIMQANFDSALDARYAIGRGVLWSTFLHPLGSLTEDDFLSGIGQTINIVTSFGTTFTSGVFTFGGGDSDAIIQRQLLDELKKRGRSI